MKRHLYELKNPCTNKTGLELTDEIRENVICNRNYSILYPSVSTETVKAQYQNINQILGSMEVISKLNHCLDYYGKRIQDANEYFEGLHSNIVSRLCEDNFNTPHLVGRDDLMMLVDDLAKINGRNHDEMNVIYDEMLDRIKIYIDDQWEVHMIQPGLKRIRNILIKNLMRKTVIGLCKKRVAIKLRSKEVSDSLFSTVIEMC